MVSPSAMISPDAFLDLIFSDVEEDLVVTAKKGSLTSVSSLTSVNLSWSL